MKTRHRELGWTAAVFAANGMAFGSLTPRIPEFAERLQLTPGALGVVLFVPALVSLIGSVAAPRLISTHGAPRSTALGMVAIAIGLAMAVATPSVAISVAGLAIMGVTDGVADVGINVAAVDLERRRRRSVMHRLHAAWSAGLLAGGAVATAAAGAGIPLPLHLSAIGVVIGVVGVIGPRNWEPTRREPASSGFRLPPFSAALALLIGGATVSGLVEVVPFDWGALYLTERFAASPARAATAVVAAMAGMLTGRLVGDATVERVGGRRALAAAGLVAAAGTALAVLAPGPGIALAGFAVFGMGAAFAFPSLFSLAGNVPGVDRGVAVAAVATIGRVGFMAAPLAAGFIAERRSVGAALMITVVAGVLLTGVAGLARPSSKRIGARGSRSD